MDLEAAAKDDGHARLHASADEVDARDRSRFELGMRHDELPVVTGRHSLGPEGPVGPRAELRLSRPLAAQPRQARETHGACAADSHGRAADRGPALVHHPARERGAEGERQVHGGRPPRLHQDLVARVGYAGPLVGGHAVAARGYAGNTVTSVGTRPRELRVGVRARFDAGPRHGGARAGVHDAAGEDRWTSQHQGHRLGGAHRRLGAACLAGVGHHACA